MDTDKISPIFRISLYSHCQSLYMVDDSKSSGKSKIQPVRPVQLVKYMAPKSKLQLKGRISLRVNY